MGAPETRGTARAWGQRSFPFVVCFWLALFSVRSSFAANVVFQSFVTWISTRPSNLVRGISETDSKTLHLVLTKQADVANCSWFVRSGAFHALRDPDPGRECH